VENRKNLLVTLADKNYIRQARQLFSSVYWNAGWEGDYMLLSHEIPEEDLRWFREKGILIRECKPLYNGPMGDGSYATLVLDKFYLFTEEFKQWGHIVFLDSDIMVKSSLEGLTKVRHFGAVQDIYFKRLYTQINNPRKNQFGNISYNLKVPAFNTGVFSFSSDIITPDTFSELCRLIFDHISNSSFGEQLILNLYFYKNWEKLPSVYNGFINYHSYTSQKKINSIIMHFARILDYPQLWDPENPFYQEWKTNLEKAEFIDLNKVPRVKNWSLFKIKYYSLVLKMDFSLGVISYKLIPPVFRYKLEAFFRYRLKSFFRYIIYTPDRLIGKIGSIIKKNNPDLYRKLRKIKGEK